MNTQEFIDIASAILRGLPKAHYLKYSTIDVELDTTAPTSYFNPANFEIKVALSNIVDAINNAKKFDEKFLTTTIRSLLYHEISHAILTPRELKPRIAEYIKYRDKDSLLTPNLVNVVEDERIETLLKSYYRDVDFKQNLKNIVEFDKDAKNFEHFVFNALRFRYAPTKAKEISKLINDFIIETKDMNFTANPFVLLDYMNCLIKSLYEIWNAIPKESNEDEEGKEQAENEESNQSSTGGESQNGEDSEQNEEEDTSTPSSTMEGESEETEEEQDTASTPSNEDGEEEDTEVEVQELTEEEVENAVKTALFKAREQNSFYGNKLSLDDFFSDKSTKAEMIKRIAKNTGFGTKQAPITYGYNGKFNKKNFIKDCRVGCDTYKWFQKRSFENETEGKKGNVKTLNIWLDNSGSYRDNDFETNKILKALAEIEAKRDDFKFNLIVFGTHFYQRFGKERISFSQWDNSLPVKEVAELYKKVNNFGNEFNIVLFDGVASYEGVSWSKGVGRGSDCDSYRALKPFNNKRSLFITESSNALGIRTFAKDCRAIIIQNSNYPQTLKSNIIKAFDLLF